MGDPRIHLGSFSTTTSPFIIISHIYHQHHNTSSIHHLKPSLQHLFLQHRTSAGKLLHQRPLQFQTQPKSRRRFLLGLILQISTHLLQRAHSSPTGFNTATISLFLQRISTRISSEVIFSDLLQCRIDSILGPISAASTLLQVDSSEAYSRSSLHQPVSISQRHLRQKTIQPPANLEPSSPLDFDRTRVIFSEHKLLQHLAWIRYALSLAFDSKSGRMILVALLIMVVRFTLVHFSETIPQFMLPNSPPIHHHLVCMVQPKSKMDLQFESIKLSTHWGYVSAVLLCVATFGTIATMSGFFLNLMLHLMTTCTWLMFYLFWWLPLHIGCF